MTEEQNGTGAVRGHVRFPDEGIRLRGANVFIPGTETGAATDAEGRFEIRNIPPGAIILECQYIGFKRARIKLDIEESHVYIINFDLAVDPSVKGCPVIKT